MADARRILIVYNPASGNGRGLKTAREVARVLEAEPIEVDLHATQQTGDAQRAAADARRSGGYYCVAACGGDGTVQEVANALAGPAPSTSNRPLMGVIPAGRCNDFSRALGIRRDVEQIASVLARGRTQAIDLGRVNGRFFCTIATLGIDAEITSFVDRRRLPIRGTLAYVYGALRVIVRYRPHRVRITGETANLDQDVFLASCANTASYGGAIHLVPHATPTSGRLVLCVIDRVGRLGAVALLCSMLLGKHAKYRRVHFIEGAHFHFDAPETLEFWADGELVGTTPAEVEIAPNALDVLVPH